MARQTPSIWLGAHLLRAVYGEEALHAKSPLHQAALRATKPVRSTDGFSGLGIEIRLERDVFVDEPGGESKQACPSN